MVLLIDFPCSFTPVVKLPAQSYKYYSLAVPPNSVKFMIISHLKKATKLIVRIFSEQAKFYGRFRVIYSKNIKMKMHGSIVEPTFKMNDKRALIFPSSFSLILSENVF